MKTIELHGGNFANKGAQLMLATVAARLQDELPDLRICVDPRDGPYSARAAAGFWQVVPPMLPERFRGPSAPFSRMLLPLAALAGRAIPPKLAAAYGQVRRHDVDALIDVSGYRFGDPWPAYASLHFSAKAESFARQGRPVVLMPQMFGPFRNHPHRTAFERILAASKLVYARDAASAEYARAIRGGEKVRIAPDLTIFAGDIHSADDPTSMAALVPNVRMLDQGQAAWGDGYVERLIFAGRLLAARGLDLSVVVHEVSEPDLKIARHICNVLGAALHVERDPLRLKKFLSLQRLVIGSRFHALVGALSTGIPAIALGWAHKYQMLLDDFGVGDLIHEREKGEAGLAAAIDELLDDGSWQERRRTLLGAREAMRPRHDEMWREVIAEVQD